MSTVQDFKNAPVGATATSPRGSIAFKTARIEDEWSLYDSNGYYFYNLSSDEMGGFTLDPAAPTTAREALDLAWELAHEVKEGQTIPGRERTIRRYEDGDFFLGMSLTDRLVTEREQSHLRTLDPLPDPKPEWTKAPAVVAFVKGWASCAGLRVFERGNETGTQWVRDTKVYHWYELVGVVPLYPKEG